MTTGDTGAETPTPVEPLPAEVDPAVADRLRELDELRSAGLIDDLEYDATRTAVLGEG